MVDNIELIGKYGQLADWSKYKIVPVFPHADETLKLDAQGKESTDCVRSDLNWLYRGKLYFVTIASDDTEEEFIFSGVVLDVTNAEGVHGGSFSVSTIVKPLYTNTVESILDKIALWIDSNPDKLSAIYEMPEDSESHRKFAQIIESIDTD